MISRTLLLGAASVVVGRAVVRASRCRPRPRSSGGTRWAASSARRSMTWPRVQQVADGVQGRPGLQGHLYRDDDRRDRRVPRQAAAAHRAGVRGRHGDHDGRQGRDRSGVPADGRRRRAVRSEAYLPAVYRLLLRRPTASSCRCRSTARRRSSTTTRTPSRRPGSTPTSRRRPGRSSEQAAKKLLAARRPVRLHQPVADLDPDREFRRLAQRSLRHRGERLCWHRHRAHDQRSAARAPHRQARQVAQGEDLRLRRPRG